MHDILGCHEVCAQSVPRGLTNEHKHNCAGISSHLLEWYHSKDYLIASSLAMRLGFTICTKQRRLSKSALILHDSAWPHTAGLRNAFRVWNFKFSTIQDTVQTNTSSDFHLFWPVKGALRHYQFADDKVKEVVHDWLCTQPKLFFYACRKLVANLTECTEVWTIFNHLRINKYVTSFMYLNLI